MKKRLDFRSFCVSTAAVLLLSLVLTALPFAQRIVENTLYIGFPIWFLSVRVTAAGGFAVFLGAGGLAADLAIAYAVLCVVRRLCAAGRKRNENDD